MNFLKSEFFSRCLNDEWIVFPSESNDMFPFVELYLILKLIFLPALIFVIYYTFAIDQFAVTSCTVLYASYNYPLGDLYGFIYYIPIIISTIILSIFGILNIQIYCIYFNYPNLFFNKTFFLFFHIVICGNTKWLLKKTNLINRELLNIRHINIANCIIHPDKKTILSKNTVGSITIIDITCSIISDGKILNETSWINDT